MDSTIAMRLPEVQELHPSRALVTRTPHTDGTTRVMCNSSLRIRACFLADYKFGAPSDSPSFSRVPPVVPDPTGCHGTAPRTAHQVRTRRGPQQRGHHAVAPRSECSDAAGRCARSNAHNVLHAATHREGAKATHYDHLPVTVTLQHGAPVPPAARRGSCASPSTHCSPGALWALSAGCVSPRLIDGAG